MVQGNPLAVLGPSLVGTGVFLAQLPAQRASLASVVMELSFLARV